jgi:probable rRNA maturation factor
MNKPKKLSTHLFKEKVVKIFIHGFLHLLDFDHIKITDYKKMRNEEKKIFKSVQKFIN